VASILEEWLWKRHGQEWIRTTEGVKPADLQSAPFGRFGTYPDFLFAQQFEFRDFCPKCRDSRAMGASYIELMAKRAQADFYARSHEWKTARLRSVYRGFVSLFIQPDCNPFIRFLERTILSALGTA
jgi:hypothetical protein